MLSCLHPPPQSPPTPPRYRGAYPPWTRCPLEALIVRDFFLYVYKCAGLCFCVHFVLICTSLHLRAFRCLLCLLSFICVFFLVCGCLHLTCTFLRFCVCMDLCDFRCLLCWFCAFCCFCDYLIKKSHAIFLWEWGDVLGGNRFAILDQELGHIR